MLKKSFAILSAALLLVSGCSKNDSIGSSAKKLFTSSEEDVKVVANSFVSNLKAMNIEELKKLSTGQFEKDLESLHEKVTHPLVGNKIKVALLGETEKSMAMTSIGTVLVQDDRATAPLNTGNASVTLKLVKVDDEWKVEDWE